MTDATINLQALNDWGSKDGWRSRMSLENEESKYG
jgi:hypothetical protein